MKDFNFKTKSGSRECCSFAAATVLLAAATFWAGLGIWSYQQPKFQDVKVELGTESISIRDFMTDNAKPNKVGFVSDPALVNLNRTGETEIVLSHGGSRETVILSVCDTTAPKVVFEKKLVKTIDYTPNPEDFVISIADADNTKVYFAHDVAVPKDYSDTTVTVVVEDASGNRTEGECVLSWRWIPEEVRLEYGNQLTVEDVLLDPVRDISLIDPQAIERINGYDIGTYTITSTLDQRTIECKVMVEDTVGPQLEVRDVQVRVNGSAKLESFVTSVTDVSGVADVRLMTELEFAEQGKQTVVIEAEDIHGNVTTKEAVLWVATDFYAPRITGADEPLSVEKHGKIDLMKGVSAVDNVDSTCEVHCDLGALDVNVAGTYFVTYIAVDSSGNQTEVKRKITVEHDMEDTMAMVREISDSLSNDPEEIRDYVRSSIRYNHDWGGEDPIWYGFTTRTGNCYVHAHCLKAIFDLKGIENQLIWVEAKSHYWLLVKIDGAWKHIDPTPGRTHSKYSLMNDAERLSTLSGRKWDTSLWPACE